MSKIKKDLLTRLSDVLEDAATEAFNAYVAELKKGGINTDGIALTGSWLMYGGIIDHRPTFVFQVQDGKDECWINRGGRFEAHNLGGCWPVVPA